MQVDPMAEPVEVLYIAGSSYSGSTVLGLVISAAPGVFYPGEVKLVGRNRAILDNDYCTCGEHYSACPFWSGVIPAMDKSLYLREASVLKRVAVLSRLAFARRRGSEENGEDRVLRSLLDFARSFHHRDFRCILDNSKGLWRLHRLASNPHVKLRVIHLRRSLTRTAASYKKREGSYLKGLFIASLHNRLIQSYLERFRIDHVAIAFEELLEDEASAIAKVNAFLGTAIPSENYVSVIRAFPHHVLGGNPMRLQHGKHLERFTGIEK
jgi:hypothetical protein